MSLFSNNINITGTNNFNPFFTWQVGLDDNTYPISDLRFRATIRPLSNNENFNRLPSSEIYYEETGIILNTDNLGSFNFSLEKNISSINGPLRDYQVVIEAHDLQGNTSAGNKIGEDEANSWNVYPFGYDVVAVANERQTGIELSAQVLTQISGNGNYVTGSFGYASKQYLGGNGEIIISYTSGSFTPDLIGGFIYCSANQFPKLDVQTGSSYWSSRVQKTRFGFNPYNGFIDIPNGGFNIRGAGQGYVSISFFDEIDRILLDEVGIDISTGLYMSNNARIYSDMAGGTLTFPGTTVASIVTTGYPSLGSTRVKQLIGSGQEISRTSNFGTSNTEYNITTILYMTAPLNNYHLGTNGNIILSNGSSENGGLGNAATNYNFGNKNPGGFYSGHLVPMANGTYKYIKDIQVGDFVKSFIMPENWELGQGGFNYLQDNWENAMGDVANGFNISGRVTKIHSNLVDSYTNLSLANGVVSGSPECFYLKGFVGGIPAPQFSKSDTLSVGLYLRFNIRQDTVGTIENFERESLIEGLSPQNSSLALYHLEVEPYKTFGILMTSGGTIQKQWRNLYVHDAIQNY